MENLKITIGRLTLKNPLIAASGTFGYGEEMARLCDLSGLGAIVTKTITLEPREGNPPPRIVETPAGMLNSIGLENKGLKDFMFNKVKFLEKIDARIIVSIAGGSMAEFQTLAETVSGLRCVAAIELNLSCPNVIHTLQSSRYQLIAQDRKATAAVVRAVRKKTRLTLITKLTPNVTDITDIGKAAEDAGSDALSAINTILGLSIDIRTGKPRLGRIVGGLSGPAIKPVALRCVWQLSRAVKIPIIGSGGIMTGSDALEFIIAGCRAVQIGTAHFIDPEASSKILDEIKTFLRKNRIRDIMSLVGTLAGKGD
ncbi:MAG: dihydroorotate dehydrogenase [Candidatus Omnitrophica bacterium]|nr:dihydroorotate dehydrogenase [Candidatus Omnitrophota bacterium]